MLWIGSKAFLGGIRSPAIIPECTGRLGALRARFLELLSPLVAFHFPPVLSSTDPEG
jgi:hypothetical protein